MNNTSNNEVSQRVSWLENISFYVMLGVMFLLPLIFIPVLATPFQFTKTAFLLLGILIAFFLYVISRLEDGRIILPYNKIIAAAWTLPIAYFVSALFSDTVRESFIGNGIAVDTFGFIFGMTLLLTLTPLLLRTKEKVLRVYVFLLFSFSILALYQIARLFFGVDFLSFDIFTTSVSGLLGRWNDLSIFIGLATILSFLALEGLRLNKQSKGILYGVLAVSLFLLSVINFFPVWLTIGLFALSLFVYGISKKTFQNWKQKTSEVEGEVFQGGNKNTVSYLALFILVISLAFIIFGNSLGTYTSSFFNITQIEARPSWQSTVDIGKQVYEKNALFGAGPNTFVSEWVKYKPTEINNSIFWNVDFATGIGFIPTSFITVGIIGVLAWILFLGAFLYVGLRVLVLRPVKDSYTYFLMLSSFLGSLYLWVMAFFYIPNTVLVAFAFMFTGIFLASLRFDEGIRPEREIIFASNPRLGFVAVLLLTVFLIVDSIGIYIIGGQYLSSYYFQKSVYTLNIAGDIDASEKYLTQSVQLSRTDRSMRFAAEVQLVRLNQIFSSTEMSSEEQQNQFQAIFGGAVESARAATALNPNNYQNWMTLGRVYGSVVSLNIEGAYDNARRSYEKSLEFNPNNPFTYLTLAQLEVANGNTKKAKELISIALEKKNNYTEAVFLLAQIQVQEGNLNEAIVSVEAATVLDPRNSVTFFQLGVLRLNVGDDLGAISALEQAIALNDVYSNARYFLGLAYNRVDRNQEAIVQFERIASLNPDNEQIKIILQNLRGGNSPFTTTIEDTTNLNQLPIKGE